MSMLITPCSNRTIWAESVGIHMSDFITYNTTPEKFDAEYKTLPGYELTMGDNYSLNALCRTAMRGNVSLVEHIVTIGGKELLEHGNANGCTPLFCAVIYGKLGTANKLIELGANVNTSTFSNYHDSRTGNVPCNATPLWKAASDFVSNIAIVKLLLRNNALVSPPLDAYGTQNIETAKQQMAQESLLFEAVIFADSGDRMPSDLTKIIEGYARCLPEAEHNHCYPAVIEEIDEKKELAASKPAENDNTSWLSCTVM